MSPHDIVVKSLPARRVAVLVRPAHGFGATNLGPIIGPATQELYDIERADEEPAVLVRQGMQLRGDTAQTVGRRLPPSDMNDTNKALLGQFADR